MHFHQSFHQFIWDLFCLLDKWIGIFNPARCLSVNNSITVLQSLSSLCFLSLYFPSFIFPSFLFLCLYGHFLLSVFICLFPVQSLHHSLSYCLLSTTLFIQEDHLVSWCQAFVKYKLLFKSISTPSSSFMYVFTLSFTSFLLSPNLLWADKENRFSSFEKVGERAEFLWQMLLGLISIWKQKRNKYFIYKMKRILAF